MFWGRLCCFKTIIPDSQKHPLATSGHCPDALLRWIRVKDNTAGQRGAGICNCGVGVTLTITNGTVSGNNAGDGIGGGIINFGTLTVTNSMVNGNTASRGGGIFNDGAVVTLTNSTVSENVALSGIGGIYNDRGGSLDVANTSIVDNSGGGILAARPRII